MSAGIAVAGSHTRCRGEGCRWSSAPQPRGGCRRKGRSTGSAQAALWQQRWQRAPGGRGGLPGFHSAAGASSVGCTSMSLRLPAWGSASSAATASSQGSLRVYRPALPARPVPSSRVALQMGLGAFQRAVRHTGSADRERGRNQQSARLRNSRSVCKGTLDGLADDPQTGGGGGGTLRLQGIQHLQIIRDRQQLHVALALQPSPFGAPRTCTPRLMNRNEFPAWQQQPGCSEGCSMPASTYGPKVEVRCAAVWGVVCSENVACFFPRTAPRQRSGVRQ